jgi:hypothetical protein
MIYKMFETVNGSIKISFAPKKYFISLFFPQKMIYKIKNNYYLKNKLIIIIA